MGRHNSEEEGAIVDFACGETSLCYACGYHQPVNMSVSFIMVNACFSFVLLSACYLACDVIGLWSGAPFYYPGMNSILLYVGHELTQTMFPWAWKVDAIHWQHLGINLWGTSLWVIISIWLYYKKFFLAI